MIILYSSKFAREFKKLPKEVKKEAFKKEAIFRKNPHAPELKTHKLKGKFSDFYSFSINHSYRIIFEFAPKDTVYFHAAGNHSVYE